MGIRHTLLRKILEDGHQPESIWLNSDRRLEMRFVDGEVTPLPGAAVGSQAFNGLAEQEWLDATESLLAIAILGEWGTGNYDNEIVYIRTFPAVPGKAMRVYPE